MQEIGHTDAPPSEDVWWMRHAVQLAEDAVGMAAPNPTVGCVLVKDGAIVGRGQHHYDRLHHAEVVALQQAGSRARGATAYVTLEPCSHTGRTPPCAQALIHAGVARVVAATGDPNPQVNGKGLARLREAGVEVSVGALAEEARALNNGFARWVRHRLPYVTLKAAVSLDGRLSPERHASATRAVSYLTGARSLLAVHTMRHASDAVLTGIGTVLADDPLLTDRSGLPRRRPLLRVVLDSQLRMPLDSRLVHTADRDVLVCTVDRRDDPAFLERRAALAATGVQICSVADDGAGRPDLRAVLGLLAGELRVLNLLAEAGSHLTRALLSGSNGTQIADRLCLFYAPLLLGERGVPLLAGDAALALEVSQFQLSESGSDFRVETALRDPWRAA